jgi:hypothetical protein
MHCRFTPQTTQRRVPLFAHRTQPLPAGEAVGLDTAQFARLVVRPISLCHHLSQSATIRESLVFSLELERTADAFVPARVRELIAMKDQERSLFVGGRMSPTERFH